MDVNHTLVDRFTRAPTASFLPTFSVPSKFSWKSGAGIRGLMLLKVPFTAIVVFLLPLLPIALIQETLLHDKPLFVQAVCSIGLLVFCGFIGGLLFVRGTSTGKSTAIRELLAGALYGGDRAVIADPEGTERNWRNYARVFLTSQQPRLQIACTASAYPLLAIGSRIGNINAYSKLQRSS